MGYAQVIHEGVGVIHRVINTFKEFCGARAARAPVCMGSVWHRARRNRAAAEGPGGVGRFWAPSPPAAGRRR